MVRQQFGVEYRVDGDSVFQFDTSVGEDPCITVDYQRVTQEQWTITKDGTYGQVSTIIGTSSHCGTVKGCSEMSYACQILS